MTHPNTHHTLGQWLSKKSPALLLLLVPHLAVAKATIYQYPTPHSPQTQVQNLSVESNEYWQTVSGKALKAGVELAITDDKHLIRLAPKARFEAGQVIAPKAIDVKQLKLTDSLTQRALPVQQKANQVQMQQAGFDDGSIALTRQGKGLTRLKTAQNLNDNAQYLIHVKEPNSKHVLRAKSHFNKDTYSDTLSASFTLANQHVTPSQVAMKVHSPVGEQVSANYQNGQVRFSQPLEQIGAINGFYEIEALVTQRVNGELVKRSIKLPFTNSMTTARLGDASLSNFGTTVTARMPLTVNEPGRYSVTATLMTRQAGKEIALATVALADDFQTSGVVSLPFKLKSPVAGPLYLANVELVDQTRMLKFDATPKGNIKPTPRPIEVPGPTPVPSPIRFTR